jgi:hypothetical protein
MESKGLARRAFQPVPILPGCLKQRAGADDVGFDEIGRAVDRAVNMGFGRQMHHCARPVFGKNAGDRLPVADIRLLEDMARIVARVAQGFQIASIGQLVEIDDCLAGLGDQLANHCRSDEAGTACNDNCHVIFRCCAVGWWINTAVNVNVKRITANKNADSVKSTSGRGKFKSFFTQIWNGRVSAGRIELQSRFDRRIFTCNVPGMG